MQDQAAMQTRFDVDTMSPGPRQQWPLPKVVEPGTVLFRQGSDATEVFWIMDGVVKLAACHSGQSSPACTVGLRRSWSLLGAFSARPVQAYTVSASALTRTWLYRFGARDFRERLADPAFSDCARQAMSRTLQADIEDDTRACLHAPEQRLTALLSIFVSEPVAPGDCVNVSLPRGIDLVDLAGLIRVTPAELTELLGDWGQRGFVSRDQHGFVFYWTLLTRAMGRTAPGWRVTPDPGVRPTTAIATAPATASRPVVPSVPRAARDIRVIKALALIEEAHAQAGFGIGELSRHVHLSPWHLSRLLKSATRMTFRQLRDAVRIERARVALLTTELSIKEIAARVGYTHASDLTRHFGSIHRLSPIAYRMRARDAAAIGPAQLPDAMPMMATAVKQ